MTDNIKYLTNGKKVAVIGKLNKTEWIVQEIHITPDGDEVPMGESFLAKNLMDTPCDSWEARRKADLESAIKKLEAKSDEIGLRVRKAEALAKIKASSLMKFQSQAGYEQLELLRQFVSGEITHLVVIQYNGASIADFDEELATRNDWGMPEGLRLLGLYGGSDGSLTWRITRYPDGYGSAVEVLPAMSMEHALELAQDYYDELINEWRSGQTKSPPAADWLRGRDGKPVDGIFVPEDVSEWWREREAQSRADRIAKLEAELAKLREEEAGS